MTHANDGKKRRWAVIVVVTLSAVAAFVWAVERVGDRRTTGVDARADNEGLNAFANERTSAVEEYLEFAGAAGNGQIQDEGGDADYVVEGLRKLAGALGALNLGSPDLQVDLRVAAEHLRLNPASPAITAVVRDALISAADTLEPERGNRELSLRRLAESVRPDRPLLDQQPAVHEFFRECANAMQTARVQESADSSRVRTF